MDIERKTRRLFALRYLNRESSDDLIEWAKLSLEAGFDSKSLRILAGLWSPVDQPEVQTYFERSLKELHIELPSAVMPCLESYCRDVAEDILAKRVTPSEGCREIYKTILFLYETTEETMASQFSRWIYIDDELDPDTYECLTETRFDQAVMREAKALIDSFQSNEK